MLALTQKRNCFGLLIVPCNATQLIRSIGLEPSIVHEMNYGLRAYLKSERVQQSSCGEVYSHPTWYILHYPSALEKHLCVHIIFILSEAPNIYSSRHPVIIYNVLGMCN